MRLPITRLRGCEHDARTPRKTDALRPCPHSGTVRRLKPLDRGRSRTGPAGHRTVAPALLGPPREPGRRPRQAMEVRRRPSEPSFCAHVPPPAALRRLLAHVTGFGMVCVATYAIMIGAMIAATLTR